MSRFALVYVLLAVVILAVAGLAYYGYRSSAELATFERNIMLDTLSELAEEKVFGIESKILEVENAAFDAISLDNLAESQELLRDKRVPVENVLVLDQRGSILPGGFFTARDTEAATEFRALFEAEIRADLRLEDGKTKSRHHHGVYLGRPHLLAVLRRFERGKTYFIVVDADLTYWVGSVFPQFFDVRSRGLYQVIDESGNIIYGFSFGGINPADVVARGFPETLRRWRLRVAQREAGSLASRGEKQATVDLVLISLALAVIVLGLAFILFAMRRERRLNRLKSDFISNVSHELKTPLSIISMFGELLSMGRVRSPEQATEYAEIIRRESVRLSRLIDNVLDFSKIERGVDVYEFASGQDLGDIVRRALEYTGHRLDTAKMTLEVRIEDDLPPTRLDANALTLAVLNLVDNAIKYAASGERLVVSVRRQGNGLCLEVEDFGPGVALDERDQIFERFYRARGVRLKPIRGSGIGLALVRHIAEGHGGKITVCAGSEGDGGEGSRFQLWIPVAS